MAVRYPVMLDVSGRPVLVVGGGAVATRKVLDLVHAGAHATVVAPSLTAPLAELARTGHVAWIEEPYTVLPPAPPGDGRAWSLVVAATDIPAVNAQIAADAERAGTWANEVTAPDGGRAALPATRHDGALTVAVSTDGVHPAAARWFCDQAAGALGPEAALVLALIDEVRLADLASGGTGRRPDWRQAVESGTLDLIRAGHLAEAKERLQACLSSSSD